jgi:hydroxypyruvate isomerase
MDRRALLKNISLAAAAVGLPALPDPKPIPAYKYMHSVCRWCFQQLTLEELCDMAIDAGIHSVELLHPEEWDIVLGKGLKIALSNGSSLGITKGWNSLKNHGQLQADLLRLIPLAAEKGIPQIIVFSGNRNGISDDDAIEACAKGLDPIVKYAEQYKINLVMELLNSKIEHPDYQCDHTSWGVRLVDKIGSSNFKLLYDIYHMQIMEGDVIRTIETYKDYIGHYHTAGVPGRNEIDESQELFYPAIMRAISGTGFSGFVAQEFIPRKKDVAKSLKEAIRICSV